MGDVMVNVATVSRRTGSGRPIRRTVATISPGFEGGRLHCSQAGGKGGHAVGVGGDTTPAAKGPNNDNGIRSMIMLAVMICVGIATIPHSPHQ